MFQGNLQFTSDGEHAILDGEDTLKCISELTSTEAENARKALLYRTVATGGGEVIEKGHNEQEASYGRDAFAKVFFFWRSRKTFLVWHFRLVTFIIGRDHINNEIYIDILKYNVHFFVKNWHLVSVFNYSFYRFFSLKITCCPCLSICGLLSLI